MIDNVRYFHTCSEFIQIMAYNNYEGFPHVDFYIFTKINFKHSRNIS